VIQSTCRFRRRLIGTGLLVAGGLSLLFQSPQSSQQMPAAPGNSTTARRAIETLGERPLGFEQNAGQFDAATQYAARGAGYGIYLTQHDAVFALRRKDNNGTATLRMTVANSVQAPAPLAASERQSGTVRYYRGQAAGAARLAAEAQTYARVTRHNVYDGIDLVYYGNQRRLEYDFVVAPGRDPRVIGLNFTGADRLEIEPASGDLLLHVAGGDPVRQHKPVTYQVIDGTRREVESRYVLAENARVQFEVGSYDTTRPLVIDPVLTYSTYFGSLSQEMIYDIALDAAGNIYVGGLTEDHAAFPVKDAFQPNKPGKRDGFVSKFNPAGTALIYSTFLGGSEADNETEHILRLAADAAGNAYIVGSTMSPDFPVTPNADDPTFSNGAPSDTSDGYYTKLDAAGALVYSTYIGGAKKDFATGVDVDNAGNVYISGVTNSAAADGFTLPAGAFDATLSGFRDDFILKFDAAGTKVYGTYVGGDHSEHLFDIYGGMAADNEGKVYIVGETSSAAGFPLKNEAQATFAGMTEAFLTVIDTTKANAAGLVYSTYIGGANTDAALSVAYAGAGQVVVVGEAGANFPTKNALYANAPGGIRDAFIARYDTTQAGANSLLWSTYYGGNARDHIWDVDVDPAGNVHIVGDTLSPNFPFVQAVRTTLFSTNPFAAKLTANGQTIVYSTFLGGATNGQTMRGVVANAIGETYMGGSTWLATTDPPNPQGHLIRNPYQATYGGGDADAWIAKIGFDTDLQITMTATPEPVLPNHNVTYTLSVTNISADAATNVVVTDTLPAEVTFISCNATGGMCGGTENARIVTFGPIAGNGTASATIVARVNLGLGSNVAFTNTATVTSTTADSNQANNTANTVSHTPTLNDPTGDPDGDGLQNGWEQQFGLDPFDGDPNGAHGRNGDPDGDGVPNWREYEGGTHPRGFIITYLAEGATGSFFDTRLAVANPGDFESLVLCRFQSTTGAVERYYVKVAPHSRATIDVETLPNMGSVSFSTLVEADEQVVVDRTMTWDDSGYGSHAERGTLTRTATTWYLAEGATHGNFSLFYLIQNAGLTTAEVDVTFLLPAGQAPIVKHYSIPGDTRFNVNVDDIPELADAEMSAVITSTNGVPIVVERAMYLNTPQQPFAAGHGSAGVTAPATRWFLAEGATGPFFDMFILIGNPTNQNAVVEAKYQLIDGGIITKTYDVAANSRFNIMVDNEGGELANAAVSTTLTSTNNVPIIVERTMWFPGPTPAQWREAHNSFAETQTGTRWAVAEGEQGGPRNAETYILIANTSEFAGQARVRLLFEDGTTAERIYQMSANSRTNAQIGVDFPEAAGKRFGAVIESLGGTPAQIVVERAMYTSPNGDTWTAGTNAVATKLQ
jgi:uncharacterized repeat protein (TIGR01451 family)